MVCLSEGHHTHRRVTHEGKLPAVRRGRSAVRPLPHEVRCVDPDEEWRRQRLFARHVAQGRTTEQARDWAAAVDEPNARVIRASRERAERMAKGEWAPASFTRLLLREVNE